MENHPIAIVTGSSSGFGFLTVIELLKAGYYVIATMRNMQKAEPLLTKAREQKYEDQIEIFPLDVTRSESIHGLKERIKQIGRVDLLVNNAGYALGGFAEEVTLEELHKQFNTNFFGLVGVTQSIFPFMREQGRGRIINISSISGRIGFPALSSYVSSKYAVEGYSESLRLELKPFNIDVILIEPGSLKTNIWTLGRVDAEGSHFKESPYAYVKDRIEHILVSNQESYGDPQEVAKLVVQAAMIKRPKLRYTIGKGVKLQLLLKQILPWKIWELLILRMIRPNKS